jgi:hypothetical protein
MNSTPVDYEFNYGGAASQTQRIETNQRHLSERRDNVLCEVIEMEVKMGIASHWQAGDQENLKTLTYIKERQYYHALDELRRLVIQRFFELHKLNLSLPDRYVSVFVYNDSLGLLLQEHHMVPRLGPRNIWG